MVGAPQQKRTTLGGTHTSERALGLYRWLRHQWKLRKLVALQIASGQPPAPRATFERLRASGLSARQARRLIGAVLDLEIGVMLRDRRGFDNEEYARRLSVLPDAGAFEPRAT